MSVQGTGVRRYWRPERTTQAVDLPEIALEDLEPIQGAEVILLHSSPLDTQATRLRGLRREENPVLAHILGYRRLWFTPTVGNGRRIVLDLALERLHEARLIELFRQSAVAVTVIEAGDTVPWCGRLLARDMRFWPYRIETETCRRFTAKGAPASTERVRLHVGNASLLLEHLL